MSLPEKLAYWKGIPRKEIDWHPYIDESKCTGCGMCVTSCGREVFSYDKKTRNQLWPIRFFAWWVAHPVRPGVYLMLLISRMRNM